MLCNYSYIMLLYFFDLKIKDLKAYNTIKRRFYYQLGKSNLSTLPWKTKSVLAVPIELEYDADAFFSQWRPNIEVYKVRPATGIETIA